GKRRIPDLMLRLANDKVGWDNYPWGSYMWLALYSQLKNANVRRWSKLYATQPTTEIDKKSYSIFGYTWAFKTWILESFRVTATRYYNRYNWYHRVAAWKKKGKFMGTMVHGTSSCQPSKYVRQANKGHILVSQHYGISDLSEFPSMQGGPSSFQTHPNSNSFFNIGTPTHWQTLRPLQPGSSSWQTQMSSQPGPSDWQSQMPVHPIPSHMGNSNLQTPIGRHHDAAGLFDQNILIQGKREHHSSFYKQSPYMKQPPSTVLPKKRGNKTKNNVKKSNLSPLNLENALDDDNEGGDDVIFVCGQFTGNYLVYENVDVSKVRRENYVDYTDFLNNPESVYLDCYMKG
nr:phospholipase-like protein [Tanacetum cinerariifolium]